MNITVVADESGRILGFSYDAPQTAGSGASVVALASGEGQQLHTVKLTPELAHRLGDKDFDDEIYRHVVAKKGRVSTLVPAKALATRKKR